MTTSGTYAITITATQMCAAIYRTLGIIAAGQAPDAQQTQDAIQAINMWMLQQKGPENASRPGQMMWLRETDELSLNEGQFLYELKPSGGDLDIQIPTEILSASLRNEDDEDTLLTPMTRASYELISDKTGYGSPIRYCYEKMLDVGNFYLDQAPDETAAEYTIRIVHRRPIEVITAGSETLDVEDFWFRSMKYNCAIELALEYGMEPSNTLIALAAESKALVSTFYPENVEDIFFQPELD